MAAIWESKQYNRINWQNRPSTATALGATNLNKIDVFCNSVDNALIQIDAQKLNIETANSMLASVQYNQETGQWTFKTLAGTTYTFDQNIEKIPVSFSLSEDGVITMTTEDGTEWTCNVAELIKDYVFDDSDTIAFSKELREDDDSYHVTADVKNGSITAEKLNPDYRADILAYTTQAQEAANDSLTYSKDSQRWAEGNESEYPGSSTDNAKYYKEQAELAKQAAEQARDEAQAATGSVIMTPEKVGVGKPDNTTIGVEEDGTIKLIAKAASLLITDTQGLVGTAEQETTTQLLINAIADRVANQLVTNEFLTQQLANYVTKAMMSNVQVNDENLVPTSALAYAMQQSITANEGDITQLYSNFDNVIYSDNSGTALQTPLDENNRFYRLQMNKDGYAWVFKSSPGGVGPFTNQRVLTNSDLSRKIVSFSFPPGVSHQAGISYKSGNMLYISECINISQTIQSQGTVLSEISCEGKSINAPFTYGLIFKVGTMHSCILSGKSVVTEQKIIPGFANILIITAVE